MLEIPIFSQRKTQCHNDWRMMMMQFLHPGFCTTYRVDLTVLDGSGYGGFDFKIKLRFINHLETRIHA